MKLKKKKVKAKPKATFKLQGMPFLFRSTILLKENGEEEKIENGKDEEDGDNEQGLHQGGIDIRSEGNVGKK